MQIVAPLNQLLAAIAIAAGIAIAPASYAESQVADVSQAQNATTENSSEKALLSQSNNSLMPPILIDRRAMTVIGQGLVAAPADTAQLEFSLALRQPPPEPDLTSNNPDTTTPTIEEQLQPVVNRLIDLGLSKDNIEIQSSSLENPKLLIELEKPTRERVQEIVRQVNQAVTQSNQFFMQSIGAEYTINNCQLLETRARRAALNDAQIRARNLASDLGVKPGDILLVTEFPISGSPAFSACGSKVGVSTSPLFASTDNLPPYNPSAPTEVRALSQVSITYAIQ